MSFNNVNPDLGQFSQQTDIPVTCKSLSGEGKLDLLIRYMYFRSSESRSSSDPAMAIGQDYLQWDYDRLGGSFNFVVCDGVGQSFLGYIASEFFGRKLMEWLTGEGVKYFKRAENGVMGGYDETIATKIRSWRKDADAAVQNADIPSSLPKMVRDALIDSRDKYGSETVFACGHINYYGPLPFLILFWMGDVRIRLYDRNEKEIDIDAKWTNAERWSTKYGLKGRNQPHYWIGNMDVYNVARIMAYSDGLSALDNRIHTLSSAELQHSANQLLVSPSSDDISLIDILLPSFDKEIKERFENLPPKLSKDDDLKLNKEYRSGAECFLSWEKVKNAEQYVVMEEAPKLLWREVFRSTEPSGYLIRDRAPGKIYKYKLKVIYPTAGESEGPELLVEIKSETTKIENTGNEFEKTIGIQTTRSSALDDYKSKQVEQVVLEKPVLDITKNFDKKLVILRWDIVEKAENYSVSISQKSGGRLVFEETEKITYEWLPEEWSGEYDIVVIAHKSGSLAMQSDPKYVVLNKPKPPLPQIELLSKFTIKVGDKVQLRCQSSGEAYLNGNTYQWTIAESSDSKNFHLIKNASDEDYTYKASEEGTYYFQVRVLQYGIWSDWSRSCEVHVQSEIQKPDKLEKPIINSHKSGDVISKHSFTIAWNRVKGASAYVVEEKNKIISRNWRRVGKATRSNYYTLQGVSAGEHTYSVVALRGSIIFEESRSDELKITVDTFSKFNKEKQKKVIFLTENPNPGGHYFYTVKWQPPKDIYPYEYVLFEADNEYLHNFKRIELRVPQYIVSNQLPGTYYYKIVAIKYSNGEEILCDSNVVTSTVFLKKPAFNSFTRSSDDVIFSFSAIEYADEYELEILDGMNNSRLSNETLQISSNKINANIVDKRHALKNGVYDVRIIAYAKDKIIKRESEFVRIEVTTNDVKKV